MTEKVDPTEQLANTMEMVAQLADTFIAAAASYREQCIAAGFNETAAELMAVSVDWATIAIELARICAALVQSTLEDEGAYDGAEDVVQWLYDLAEELHPGWVDGAEVDP